MRPSSQQQLAAARKLLSDARLLAFFRAAAAEMYVPYAIKVIIRDLDKGETLDVCMGHYGPLGDKQPHRYLTFGVEQISPRVYSITFGFEGGETGDGAQWRVRYSAGAKVLHVEQVGFWKS